MGFTDLFVKRPVLAIVVNLVILIAGLQSIGSLSVRQYPRSDIAVVRVSTVYTGANADLVRGFITTPLERVIASADGIDYMESSSGQSLSTITVHLRLNYDTNDALTQIQAKVAQVRNELPPEAEAPVIEVENADSQFAALYLSFSSPDLDQNQITDYLTRVVQPKLSAIAGVQRADILGDRTFAMRIWLKPELMAAHGIAALDGARRAGTQQLSLGARADQRIDGVRESGRQYRSAHNRRVPPARRQGVERRSRPHRRHCRRRPWRRGLRGGGSLQRSDRGVHERVGAADGQLARCDPARARGDSRHSDANAGRDGCRNFLRRDRVHRRFHQRGAHDVERNAAHRDWSDLPLPGLPAIRAHPRDRDPNLARRRRLPDARGGVLDQPADAARDRALGGPGGGRCDRDGGKRRAPYPGRQGALPSSHRRRSGAGRPDRRDHHHARRRVRASWHSGRPDRSTVPRVRLHARGCRDRVRCGRADAVADDGLEAAPIGTQRARFCRLDQSPVRRLAKRLPPDADQYASLSTCRPRAVGDRGAADRAVLHVLPARARSG